MKRRAIRLLLMAVVLILTSSAMGTVYVNCTDLGNGVIQLSYDSCEEPMPIRAFGLDIEVTGGIITSLGNLSPHYNVYPGSIQIDPDGEIVDRGSPIPSGGPGTSEMTLEMGSLYPPESNGPPETGVLLTFTVNAECDITIEENALRGGVVMEDPDYDPIVYLNGLQGTSYPEPAEYGGGAGTASEPFLIYNAEQLNSVGAHPGDWYKHFKLMADIDLGGYAPSQFNIIGTGVYTPFGGVFDGNKHRISNLTYIAEVSYIGLFGYVDGFNAEIKDLDLINPTVDAGAGDNVGPLAGGMNTGTISRCSTQGGTVCGNSCVGGLIGRNFEGTVENCHSSTDVIGALSLGGLVGKTYAEVSDCYSTGSVWQYADFTGGFVGCNTGNILTSFWDRQTSGQTSAAGGTGGSGTTDVTGKSTAEMKVESTFTAAGWDFEGESGNGTEDIWTICEGESYPKLVRKRLAGDFVGQDGVNAADFAFFADCWMKDTCECLAADITGNGLVDAHDLQDLAQNWLAGL